HLTENCEVVGRRKQTGVTGHPSHPKRGGIMYLTAQPPLAFRSGISAAVAEVTHLAAPLFGRGDSRSESRFRVKTCVVHSQWGKDIPPRKLIEHLAADLMHDLAQSDVVDVAIDEAGSRLITQRLVIQTLHGLVVAGPAIAQIEIRGEAGDVGHELFDRNCFPPITF